MTVGSVSSGSTVPVVSALPSIPSNPVLAGAQANASVTSALLGASAPASTPLDALFSAAVDYSMYSAPGLMQGVVKAAMAGGIGASTSTAANTPSTPAASTPTTPAPPKFDFNPFDSTSWWNAPSGSTVNTSA
jgi:hypothetical protein